MSQEWNAEKVRRSGAYHEAAHAVVDVLEDHTVRYVSIGTEGTAYRDICVTAVNYYDWPGVGLVPAPWQALGHAISAIAGDMAAWREAGKTYPYDSWEKILQECEEIAELGDPDMLHDDTIEIRKYCKAAALFGQTVRMPTPDELQEGALSLPLPPPRTAQEAFEEALRATEEIVNSYWPEITNVAHKLMETGYLTGEEVEEIMVRSRALENTR